MDDVEARATVVGILKQWDLNDERAIHGCRSPQRIRQ
jgi:hypothetical protein